MYLLCKEEFLCFKERSYKNSDIITTLTMIILIFNEYFQMTSYMDQVLSD